jgi:hypothetical protein
MKPNSESSAKNWQRLTLPQSFDVATIIFYSYKKISFKNSSYPLIKSVYNFLKSIGLNHRIAKNLKEVRIESKNDVKKYFQLIGFHNPKNLKRYKE